MTFSRDDYLFAGAIALLAIIGTMAKRLLPAPPRLQRWARENGFTILRVRHHEFVAGPFSAVGARKEHAVYQIAVRTPEGKKQTAWVRHTHAPDMELLEVVWDDSKRTHEL